jgi:RNA polymerase sigma-70 factor (ECF subfamily)
VKVVTSTPESDADLRARFTAQAAPLLDMLARGARRLTRCDADADDLLQDALMHAYAGFDTFSDGSNFKAWLFRILYNRWVSGFRAKQRRPQEVSLDELTEQDVSRSAESQFFDALPNTEIAAAMATLPQGSRVALYYADALEYTYAETAALMEVPIGTVMSRVSRGRKRLRFALALLAADNGDTAALEPDIA